MKLSVKKFLTDIYPENGKQQATITKKSPAGWLGRAFCTARGKRQNLRAKTAGLVILRKADTTKIIEGSRRFL